MRPIFGSRRSLSGRQTACRKTQNRLRAPPSALRHSGRQVGFLKRCSSSNFGTSPPGGRRIGRWRFQHRPRRAYSHLPFRGEEVLESRNVAPSRVVLLVRMEFPELAARGEVAGPGQPWALCGASQVAHSAKPVRELSVGPPRLQAAPGQRQAFAGTPHAPSLALGPPPFRSAALRLKQGTRPANSRLGGLRPTWTRCRYYHGTYSPVDVRVRPVHVWLPLWR